MKSSEAKVVEEALAVCRAHGDSLESIADTKLLNRRQKTAKASADLLRIAAKLEVLLGPKFSREDNLAIKEKLIKAFDRLCPAPKRVMAETPFVVDKATEDGVPAKEALREWVNEKRKNLRLIRIDARPITAVMEDAEIHDATIIALMAVEDILKY